MTPGHCIEYSLKSLNTLGIDFVGTKMEKGVEHNSVFLFGNGPHYCSSPR